MFPKTQVKDIENFGEKIVLSEVMLELKEDNLESANQLKVCNDTNFLRSLDRPEKKTQKHVESKTRAKTLNRQEKKTLNLVELYNKLDSEHELKKPKHKRSKSLNDKKSKQKKASKKSDRMDSKRSKCEKKEKKEILNEIKE